MRIRIFAALLAMTLFAWPAAAQEQRGSIEGVVKDSSGAVLPGVTVEARAGGAGVLTTTSNESGNFRFPSVLPGVYEVSANLAGFKPAKVADVEVKLGSIKSVEFNLQLASVSENVTVTAESPIVDVKSSGKSTNIRAEQVALLPHARDFTSLVTQAPGVNNESKSSGVMIDGASAAENRYVIDGIETTSVLYGVSGQNLLADFVEEVQVKSTGYPAEFGGSTGGVINVLTKSGTNNIHGSGAIQFQGSSLTGANTPTLRAVQGDPTRAEYHTYPKDDVTRYEPGASIGGPVMQNKMWYFGAYQPAYTTTKRDVNAASTGRTDTNPSNTQNKEEFQYLTANATNQVGNKLRTRVAFNNSWRKTDGQLASLAGTDSRSTTYIKGTKFPNYSVSGTADYTVSSSLVLSGRLGRFMQDAHDFNVNNVIRYSFPSTTNVGMAGVPASLQHDSGWSNVPNNSGTDHDTQTRNYGQIDATWFGKAAGQHQVKGGVQIDRRGNDVVSGELKNLVTLTWTPDGTGCNFGFGPYGCYEVRSNAVAPETGFITGGNVKSNVYGVFVQDTWSLNNRLTVNLGLRTESENVPAYGQGPDVPPNPIKFGWKDKTAPRLGFSYDLSGDGKSKLYGSWGIFYDIFKLNMPRGSFGGDKWISYFYSLNDPDYTKITAGCVTTGCPGTFFTSRDFRQPSVQPGQDVAPPGTIKPMRTQELSFGFEHQINPMLAATVRYVRKNLDRAIDDVGDLTNGNESYIIANPGEGLVDVFDISTGTSVFRPQEPGGVFPANAHLITMPKAKRLYQSVEGRLEKRLSNRWMAIGSYTWSRDAGNYSGLSSSDENGRTAPNNARDYDYPVMAFNGDGTVQDGVLDTDRTHQVKLQGLYLTKWGTSLGVNEFVASGTPITRQVPIIAGSNYPVRYKGRGSDGRTPALTQTDIFVQHGFKVGGGREIQLMANVINLFNQHTETSVATTMRRTGTIPNAPGYYQEAAFYAGQLNFDDLIAKAVANGLMSLNPQFLMANGYQAPIAMRVGVKFSF